MWRLGGDGRGFGARRGGRRGWLDLGNGGSNRAQVVVARCDDGVAEGRRCCLLAAGGGAFRRNGDNLGSGRTHTLSDAQVVRSLTQLGSSFADTSGKEADYVKARYMWEIASAAGDPVAMCFLGRLFESGMSVPANRKVALNWYERAKASGGCADADDAIARLR